MYVVNVIRLGSRFIRLASVSCHFKFLEFGVEMQKLFISQSEKSHIFLE